MLQIMLCGAHDVGELSKAFTDVAQDIGAEPWFYQDGKIHHINSVTSRWAENSRATVGRVDICVFVMLDNYGEITWNHELAEALELGKPFLVMALESAYVRFMTLLRNISDPGAITSEDDRRMVELLRTISTEYQLTVTPFSYMTFKEKLRIGLSGLFHEGIRLLETRNQRSALLQTLGGVGRLSREQTSRLIALATDEYEVNKLERKTALRRLAADGLRDDELLVGVCRSREQGVQRLGFDLLPELLPLPPEQDLLLELAQIARGVDDVGVPRRLLSAVAEVAPDMLDVVLDAVGNADEGARRRAYEGLEEHWDDVLDRWGPERMRKFLDLCRARAGTRATWVERLEERRKELP